MVHELSEKVRRWVSDAVGGASVATATGLRQGGNPWLLTFGVESAVLRLGNPADPDHRRRFATEVAALRVVGDHQVPAAELIASDLDGSATGFLAVLTTVLPGHSRIPTVATTERLQSLGAAAAALQAIPLAPQASLPLRTRSIADVDFAAQRRERGTTALLAAAEERLRQLPVPGGPTVFVHGDLWFGNTLWSGDRCTGLVDWDCAGAGSPGVDLGGARFDATLMFGLPAADQVLAGWERAAGRRAEQVAYWDVVAALVSLADMAFCVPALHDQGRTDLNADLLGQRRDAFLSAALRQLDAATG
ncbi:aminoglycoside phosphotransferase family protein [Allokutzneria sp. NRRL B-24872]|uniref:aminoglycoside phosphotransferase family protein n=1 Tax=Allokutzneria sp. NRRL B-24872 TaxID=1137961 RepID=UPI001FEE925F|nr:aminoglycoside phosphotransferase family protein [Allokutzneria sp. NRRL B-24872]